MRSFPLLLRATAAAWLLLAASAAIAQSAPPAWQESLNALQAAYARSVPPGEQATRYQDLLATVLERVQRSYATEVDMPAFAATATKALAALPPGSGAPAEVFRKAVNEALRSLDPYSRYMDAGAHANERGDAIGFGGLGLEVEPGEGGVRVVAPMPGTPAARAGLQRGDLLVRVNDQPLRGVPLAEAIAKMRGEPGTPVAITVRRVGLDNEFTVSVTREIIRRQVLRWAMEGEMLVLRLGSFIGPVNAALQQAVSDATAKAQPRGIVLDLRGNPGGLLREAVLTADAFLGEGQIVSLRGRTPNNQRSWQADATELLPGVPMVVLVDRRSASAAELVASALQENGRAKVMGQRSFGKGTVQSTFTLGDHGALRLTTAYYHGPSGRSVQKTGVDPDIELLNLADETGRGEAAGMRVSAGPGEALQAAKTRVQEARCAIPVLKTPDPGLACALAYLQAGDVEAFVRAVGDASH